MDIKRAQRQVRLINQLARFLPGLAELPGKASMIVAGDLDIYVESLAEFKTVRRHFFGLVKPFTRSAKYKSFKYYFNGRKYELELNIFIVKSGDE